MQSNVTFVHNIVKLLAVVEFSCIFIIEILAFISAIFQYTVAHTHAKPHRMTLLLNNDAFRVNEYNAMKWHTSHDFYS